MKKSNKKKREAVFDDDEQDRGRKIRCSCDEDPRWCEKHNAWG